MTNQLILFNKPYRVLTQFTDRSGRSTLADYVPVPNVYPAGRLDYESEGLLLLTNVGWLQAAISEPKYKLPKEYWAQVEGIPTDAALAALASGVELKDGLTRPARASLIDPPPIWPRVPPIRERQQIPDRWIELTIHEGRNRQVRRMTAAVGYPTLRLVRHAIGPWRIDELQPGEWRAVACPRDRKALQRLLHQRGSKPR